MTYPSTEIDKISIELHELAKSYAEKAEALVTEPYFREAVMKTAVSNFVWALYHAFGDFDRHALLHELVEQTGAIRRAVNPSELPN